MAPNPLLIDFLDGRRADYSVVDHPRAFGTVEEASALGINADEVAKTLVIHISHMKGDMALVVIPGGQRVSNRKIRQLFMNSHARLATEEELARDFPQFELGAIPPFGRLVDLSTYVDRRLLEHDRIVFPAGTHTDSVLMGTHDFVNLADAAAVDVVEEPLAA